MRLPNGYCFAKLVSLNARQGMGHAYLEGRPFVKVTFYDFQFHRIEAKEGCLVGERPQGEISAPEMSEDGSPELVVWLTTVPRHPKQVIAVYWGLAAELQSALRALPPVPPPRALANGQAQIPVDAREILRKDAMTRSSRLSRRGRGFPTLSLSV
ncbi:MAG: hypothetical protein HZA81_03130 [Candidatus Taylorbacteria bacterium]|nr:hypothetical protein [Candidatus Taylorbacteria bacterium]